MRRIPNPNPYSSETYLLIEDYRGEAMELFAQADRDAEADSKDPNSEVDVLYVMCTATEDMIEIWRDQWTITD